MLVPKESVLVPVEGGKHKGTRENQIKLLDRMMNSIGRRKGFTVQRINSATGLGKSYRTVYVGYKLVPK